MTGLIDIHKVTFFKWRIRENERQTTKFSLLIDNLTKTDVSEVKLFDTLILPDKDEKNMGPTKGAKKVSFTACNSGKL